MRAKLMLALFCTFCAALVSTPAMAWSEETHMTTGAIAYDDLARSDPALLAQLDTIISAHPHYRALAAHAGALRGSQRMRVIFEWLARWPDDINGTAYEHRDWHYELRVVYGRTWLWPFRNGKAGAAFASNFETLSNANAPARDRAIALGWLIHIVGDIQQPLHAGHQMTSAFSMTDEAGSLAYIRKTAGATPVNLHQYWDKSLDVAGPVDATANRWSVALQRQIPRSTIAGLVHAGTPQQQFQSWLDESMYLATKAGYRGTALSATATPADAPVATRRETRLVEQLSKRRVVTGGYRIADTIRMALGN